MQDFPKVIQILKDVYMGLTFRSDVPMSSKPINSRYIKVVSAGQKLEKKRGNSASQGYHGINFELTLVDINNLLTEGAVSVWDN